MNSRFYSRYPHFGRTQLSCLRLSPHNTHFPPLHIHHTGHTMNFFLRGFGPTVTATSKALHLLSTTEANSSTSPHCINLTTSPHSDTNLESESRPPTSTGESPVSLSHSKQSQMQRPQMPIEDISALNLSNTSSVKTPVKKLSPASSFGFFSKSPRVPSSAAAAGTTSSQRVHNTLIKRRKHCESGLEISLTSASPSEKDPVQLSQSSTPSASTPHGSLRRLFAGSPSPGTPSPQQWQKTKQNILKQLPKQLAYISKECVREEATNKAVDLCIERGLMVNMIKALPMLPFEQKKEVEKLILRCLKSEKACNLISTSEEDICKLLLKYFKHEDLVGIAASILNKMLQSEKILKRFVGEWENIQQLLLFMQEADFDILAHSSSTLSLVLSTRSEVIDQFYQSHFEEFFDSIMRGIVNTEHRLIRTWYLSFLYTLLTMRRHVPVLLKFIDNDQYLRVIMNRLLEQSPNVQNNAVKLFSLFVLSPYKNEAVLTILKRNRNRILDHFNKACFKDDELNEMRLRIIKKIEEICEDE